MENNKFERIVYMLLRVLGVLSIIGGFLGREGFFSEEKLLVFRHKTIIGNVAMISPTILVEMLVAIILYVVFLRIVEKHIRVSRKAC